MFCQPRRSPKSVQGRAEWDPSLVTAEENRSVGKNAHTIEHQTTPPTRASRMLPASGQKGDERWRDEAPAQVATASTSAQAQWSDAPTARPLQDQSPESRQGCAGPGCLAPVCVPRFALPQPAFRPRSSSKTTALVSPQSSSEARLHTTFW